MGKIINYDLQNGALWDNKFYPIERSRIEEQLLPGGLPVDNKRQLWCCLLHL